MQARYGEAAYNAARSEMLLPEEHGYLEVEGMEKTYKITQQQLRKEVDITTAQKVFTQKLLLMILMIGI
jgi:U3 small nucleolar RNA-associated protein 7